VTMIQNYRRWFDYERDSHAKTLSSLGTVPEASRKSHSFQKAVDLLAHVVAARRMWLFRLGVGIEDVGLFPVDIDLLALPSQIAQMESEWSHYLDELDDAALSQTFEYQSSEGKRFRSRIEDILTQLFGHSWYHRGQIAALVRSLGGQPAVTDFVFWSREAVAHAQEESK